MRFVLQLVALVAVSFVGSALVGAVDSSPVLELVVGALVAVGAVLAYRWVVGRTERRTVDEVGRAGRVGGLGRGTLVGIGLFAAVILNLTFLGDYHVTGGGSFGSAVGLLGFMAAAAVTEELLYRGVLFRHVERWFGTWIAMVAVGLLFGLSHLFNPDATLWGAIAIAIEAGGMLAAAYVATRRLWLPIGLHLGWNVAGSSIFSTTVSGRGTPQGILDAHTSGATMISGGSFGPEGSLYSVAFCLVATVVFLWLAKRRGNLVPIRLPRRTPTATLAA